MNDIQNGAIHDDGEEGSSEARIPSRRRFLGYLAGGIAAAFAVDGFLLEPRLVEFTRHTLGKEGKPVRFAQLSDLHLNGLGDMHREIARALAAEQLDFLIITGDAIDGNGHLHDLDQFLSLFPRTLPKYAILGNWEHWGGVNVQWLRGLYHQHNGALLVNATAVVELHGRRILLTGLDDLISGIPSIERALAGVEPGDHHLLLAHCPAHRDYIAEYDLLARRDNSRITPPIALSPYRISYQFAGHSHGGQVNLFGLRPFLPKGCGGYICGWYDGVVPNLYVSRGIGTSILPIRIGSRPEVPLFTLMV